MKNNLISKAKKYFSFKIVNVFVKIYCYHLCISTESQERRNIKNIQENVKYMNEFMLF